jgi:hypothetical protein
MSMEIDLTAVVNDDLLFNGQARYNGAVFNLTGMTLVAVLKASKTASDGSGTTFTPAIATGTQGLFTWTIPRGDNTTTGTFWYHIYVEDAGDNATIFFGTFTVNPA